MTAILNLIMKLIPLLTPVLDKFASKDSDKARELKAQKDLEESRAFQNGRISPKYLLYYALVILFALSAFLFMTSFFFPNVVSLPDASKIKDLLEAGKSLGLD